MRAELQLLPLIYSTQAMRVPPQTGWWSHAVVFGPDEGTIWTHEPPAP